MPTGAIILLLFAALMFVLAFKGMKKKKALAEKTAAQVKRWEEHPEEKEAFLAQQKETELHKKYFSGKYISGHPNINTPIPVTNAEVNKENIVIFGAVGGKLSEQGKIPLSQIKNVSVEDASTIEKKITATRLLTLGVFAFAAKKKKVNPEFYLTALWNDGRFETETIFEFEGEHANRNANTLRNVIINRCKEQEVVV